MTSIPYAGPAGSGQLGAPLAPPPAPPLPTEHAQPNPDEVWAPGELGYYTWQDPRTPASEPRVQVVAVTHVDDQHVHGLVLGDAKDLASFGHGTLTHQHPAAG